MKKYLFLFTIGPVKNFIRESRKAQDLFASSALLSHLAKEAIIKAAEVFNNDNFEIITPFVQVDLDFINQESPSIPNRILISIKTNNNDLKTKAEKIENHLKDDFSNIKGLTLPKGAKEQLENHLDIRWVFLEYNDDNFKDQYQEINKLMAGIKNYNPVLSLAETGRKCIVDGKYNVKFYRKTDKESQKNDNEIKNKKLFTNDVKILPPNDENTLKIWILQKGEGISAVTLKKRLFQNEPHTFPSTTGIALMHLDEVLKCNEDYRRFKSKVQNKVEDSYLKHSNDQLFYPENIDVIFEKEGEKKNAKNCKDDHEKWAKVLREKNIPLTTYYALIRFDGDQMGDWFSGTFKKNTITHKRYQKTLSCLLTAFADKMKKEINSPYGKVIYAGGEDFMAMINLHYLKKSIDLIRNSFKTMVNDKMQEFITKDTNNKQREITLSMGITIAHYKEPLQLVLDKTAKMEKLAKDSGRNRFAIRVSKHSGGQLQMVLPWENDNLDKLYQIIEAILTREISPAFLLKTYNFCEEMNFDEEAKEVIKSKKKLFIDRAIEKENDKNKIFDKVNKILDDFMEVEGTIKNFAELLLIIDFIQRHEYKHA